MKNTSVDNSATLYELNILGTGAFVMPDYSAVVAVGNTTRTPSTNVVVHCDKVGANSTGTIKIDGYTFKVSKGDANGFNNHTYRSFYIKKGTEYTTANMSEVLEIPLLGV